MADIAAYIKPDDMHFARTRLLALENTIGGRVLPRDYVQAATALRARARAWPPTWTARASATPPSSRASACATAVAGFDTVSVCLSKGLGAPVGSVLLGPKAFIEQGKRWRKMLGGGMRQAGVIAAAGLYALEHNVERLADDHAQRRRPVGGPGPDRRLTVTTPQTNIFYVEMPAAAVRAAARARWPPAASAPRSARTRAW